MVASAALAASIACGGGGGDEGQALGGVSKPNSGQAGTTGGATAGGGTAGGSAGSTAGASAGASAGGSAGGTAGTTAGPDYSNLEGWQSFHPAGEERTYNSGFDGTNNYTVPMVFIADEKPTVTFADATAAQVTTTLTITKALAAEIPPSLDGRLHIILAKTRKAGRTTVTGTGGGITQTATLVINAYTPQDVTVGEARYNQGNPSCNSCHATKSLHNPGLLADLSDEAILGIAVEGDSVQRLNLSTGQVETVQPNGGNHKWTVTAAERTGLMAFLRSRDVQFQLSLESFGL